MTVAIQMKRLGWVLAVGLAGCNASATSEVGVSEEYLSQTASCPAGSNVIMGTAGDDVLRGTHKRDCLVGLGGDDRLEGGNGDDMLIGGPGNDGLFGNNGDDVLMGDAGDDVLDGGNGEDKIYGGDGNDTIEGGNGDDKIEGGLCHDSILGQNGDDKLAGNDGADRIDDGHGRDNVSGGAGPDACDGQSCEIDDCDERGCGRRGHNRWRRGHHRGWGWGHHQNDNQCECAADTDCPSGERCVTATGVCALPSDVSFSDVECDGADEDCDGNVDEDYAASPSSCGVGACASTGEMLCAGGEVMDSCEPGEPTGNDSDCDAVDDDCDGGSDESFVSGMTTCGVGACASTGALVCSNGTALDTCMPGMPVGDDSSCDGVDDDCDGMMDEGFVGMATSCGMGLCAGNGVTSCQGGMVMDSCLPITSPDDGNACTVDSCDPVLGNVHTPMAVGASCSDGDACNGEEVCAGGTSPVVSMDPRGTYLRTQMDLPSFMPAVQDLASLGLSPGDTVTISVVGAMQNSPSGSPSSVAVGLFSSSATVLAMTNRIVRVPGAVQSTAPAIVTPVTANGSLPTDIPQDFMFDQNGLTVTIPAGATHFIAGALSNQFNDNVSVTGMPYGFVLSTGAVHCEAGDPPPVCE